MRFLIERLFATAMAAGILGLAAPALAQTSGTGIVPIFISGDASLAQIKAACGITAVRASVNQNPISSPASTGDFSVTFVVSGELLSFEDISPPDQFLGTPGVEAFAVRRNSTNVYCYPTRVEDTGLDAPGSGSPNEITVVWGPGPCPLEDTTAACSAYPNPPDYIQGYVIAPSQPANFCGCGANQVLDCDPALPVGDPGSCNPQSGALTGVSSTVVGTAGTGTCQQLTQPISSGGRLIMKTYTVCDCDSDPTTALPNCCAGGTAPPCP